MEGIWDFLKVLGVVLAVIGIFIVTIQPLSPTGAVIDLSTPIAKTSFIFGLVFVVVGAYLLFYAEHKKHQ